MCVCLLRPTLCNPIDRSPPGPSVHGILQARTLEWVAISFSKRNHRKKESEVAQLFRSSQKINIKVTNSFILECI